jgi:hypothetical protein
MKVRMRTPDVVVIDDFLTDKAHHAVWSFFQEENFRAVHAHRWIKAFRRSDGDPLWGDSYSSAPTLPDRTSRVFPYPTGRGIDPFIERIRTDTEVLSFIGEETNDWTYVFARPYLYPAGSGLSWHSDGRGDVVGAYVYYAHPEWNAAWGAELLVDGSGRSRFTYPQTTMYDGSEKTLGMHLDWHAVSDAVMEQGCGTFVMPKPNRCVLLRAGVLHRINPVSAAAGDRLRASLTGFFVLEESADGSLADPA